MVVYGGQKHDLVDLRTTAVSFEVINMLSSKVDHYYLVAVRTLHYRMPPEMLLLWILLSVQGLPKVHQFLQEFENNRYF